MYKVLDLFSGAGGMSLGFEQTGKFHVSVAVEKHPYARLTYKKNHNKTHAVVLENVLDITDYEHFTNKYGHFDVIIGGPPCQGFSNANRQKNTIISQNNALVKKYVEIIKNLKPLAFVMENVSMLKSETHRFYYSKNDKINFEQLKSKRETLTLYNGICPIHDIEEYLFNAEIINELLLDNKSYTNIRTFVKNSYNEKKRNDVLDKKGRDCLKSIKNIPKRSMSVSKYYKQFEKKTLTSYINYLGGKISFEEAEPDMASFLNVQRLLSYAKELLDNHIVISNPRKDNTGIHIDVDSFTVIDYLYYKLGKHYSIKDGILNAAWYGAPQLRERYIAIGIRKDISKKFNIHPELPKPLYSKDEYRTVWDAIKDLEDIEPLLDITTEGIDISKKSYTKTNLTDVLRTSSKLYNHVIPKTRENALKRFATLKQGENFHNLDKRLIQNTYSKPERTQNSIYLRLDYCKPSGTVTNVRKSMWVHPIINRAISIREAARLQTFPDDFVFIGTKDSQYQQVGNAVPPLMAKEIAKKLYTLLNEISFNG